jgi:hypothetical protein
MRWLTRQIKWSSSNPGRGQKDSFLPLEWNEYFERLTEEQRRDACARLCRKVFAAVPLPGEPTERAIIALERGAVGPDLLELIRSVADQIEAEYDSLVGDDESNLSCTDPTVSDAFVRARAATALRCALEGDLAGMAYEAWFVLNDLDEIRKLVGMPVPNR